MKPIWIAVTATLSFAGAMSAPAAEPAPAPAPAPDTPTAFMDCPLKPSCPVPTAPAAKVISLQLAYEGAQAALEACTDVHFGGGSVAVLDAFGIPIIALRQPGARGVDIEVSRRKAYTALRTGVSGSPASNAAAAPRPAASPSCPSGSACSTANGVATPTGPDPKFDPLKGPVIDNDPYLIRNRSGILVKANGMVVGAVGVTGVPPRDEPCARAGAAYIEARLR